MPKYEKYTLMVGEEGSERLKILNLVCNPFTLDFLKNCGDLTDKRVLDLGCGTGIMSCELAKCVGKNGSVTAVDISQEQLEIAKKNAQVAGFANINFIELPANKIDQLTGQFDLIYCRFLLAHLSDSSSIVHKALALLAEGGFLLCEEPTSYEAMFSCPESNAFNQFKQCCLQQAKIHKTDFFIGRKLCEIFKNNHLEILNAKIVQPIVSAELEKRQLWLGVKELMPTLIEIGYASKDQLLQLIEDLKKFAAEPSVAFLYQYLQIIGKKQ